MAFVLAEYVSVQSAVANSDQFTFTLPNLIDSDTDTALRVESATGDSTERNSWDVTLTGFPSGMTIGRLSDTNPFSDTGFLSLTNGPLTDVQLRWTPTTGQSFIVNDGRPSRPRVWAIAIQIDGKGNWEPHEWELGITITVTDRVLHGVEFPRPMPLDADLHESIAAYGIRREIGLPWYKFDPDLQTGDNAIPDAYLTEALKRRYIDPPRMANLSIPLVQDSEIALCQMLGIEVGQSWNAGVSASDPTDIMRGVVTSVELQIAPGGHGLSFKRVNLIEAFRESVVLAINDVALSINDHELAVGG